MALTRLAILMPLASPWARQTAIQLSRLGAEVHSIDFATDAPDSYFSQSAAFQAGEVNGLQDSLAGVHLLHVRASGAARHFAGVAQLRKLLDRLKPSVLLTLYGGGFATLAWLSGFRPYVVYVVGSDVLRIGAARTALSRLALGSAALVVANGKYLGERAQRMAPSARVRSLYLGVDTTELVPGDQSTSPSIICSRGFLSLYNNGYLIEGLAALGAEAFPDLEVSFAAPGPELGNVRNLADRILPASLRERVHFLGGLSRSSLISHLQRSHVYVSLSRSDGTSASLLEAMACGVFPVLTNLPQNREWVTPNEDNGILVPFDAPPVLAGALARALTDRGWRERAASYNREKVIALGSSSRTMPELLGILDAIALGRTELHRPPNV